MVFSDFITLFFQCSFSFQQQFFVDLLVKVQTVLKSTKGKERSPKNKPR